MVDRKRKRKRVGDWHHRVPDFQLVYCGPKKNTLTEKEKLKKMKQLQKAFQQ